MATSSTPKQNLSPVVASSKELNNPSLVRVNLIETFNELQNASGNRSRSNPSHSSTEESTVYSKSYDQQSGSKSIAEIEKLHLQFRNMMMNGNTDFPSEDTSFSTISSVDTVTLLCNSPDLQLDEHGILMSSVSSNGLLQHKMKQDLSLLTENNILKENIEKERTRRKYCEQQIEELQSKLLACEEQLALALSTEKKKEILIEQFDKTLGNIVEGWKQQESAKNNDLSKLQHERDILQAAQSKQDKELKQFESDLAAAMEEFSKEQERFKLTQQENDALIKSLEVEKKSLEEKQSVYEQDISLLKNENMKLLKEKEKILIDQEAKYLSFQKEIDEGKVCKRNLEVSLSRLDGELKKCQEKLKAANESKNQELKELKDANEFLFQQKRIVLAEQDSLKKEKETLTMELSLSRSKFDALKTQQDSELRAKLEEEFNAQIYKIQRQISDTENELRLSQQEQLSELATAHRNEITSLKENFMEEMQAKDSLIFSLHQEHQNEISDLKNENINLHRNCKQLQAQRSELVSKLKYLMEQQWKDTLNIFGMDQNSTDNQLSSTLQHEDDTSDKNTGFTSKSTYDVSSIASQETNSNIALNTQAAVSHEHRQVKPSIQQIKGYTLESNLNQSSWLGGGSNQANSSKISADQKMYRQSSAAKQFHEHDIEYLEDPFSRLYYSSNQSNPRHLSRDIYDYTNNKNNIHSDFQTNPVYNNQQPLQAFTINQNRKKQMEASLPHELIPEKPFNDSNFENNSSLHSRENNESPYTLIYEDLKKPQLFVKDNQLVVTPHLSDRGKVIASSHAHKSSKEHQKQQQLTHFIEKLLQKSPGQVSENEENDKYHPISTPTQIADSSQTFKKSVLQKKNQSQPHFNQSAIKSSTLNQSANESSNIRKMIGHKINDLNEDELKNLMESLNSNKSDKDTTKRPLQQSHEQRPLQSSHEQVDVFSRLHQNIKKPPIKNKIRPTFFKETKRASKTSVTKLTKGRR